LSDQPVRYTLPESEIPTHWINLMPDLPGAPSPPLNPQTQEPAGPPDLTPIFPMGLIEQEVATDPEVEIPDEVRDVYKRWRPSPLFRARALEKALDTPAHIYYKYEGGARRSPSRAACSTSSASSTWWARATTRSRTGAR
jgi:tryptophan synthase beta chain